MAAAQEGRDGPTVSAHVKNSSQQPIYRVELAWHLGGELHREPLGTIMPGDKATKTRAIPGPTNPEDGNTEVVFTDAAGMRWLRRPDGSLLQQGPP